jgi:hypothetical protein
MGGVSSHPFNLFIYFHHNVMLQHLFKLDGFMGSPNDSFDWPIFAKSLPEKYDFDLWKDFP